MINIYLGRFNNYTKGTKYSTLSMDYFLRFLHDRTFPNGFRGIIDEIMVDIPFDKYIKYAWIEWGNGDQEKPGDHKVKWYTEKTFLTD